LKVAAFTEFNSNKKYLFINFHFKVTLKVILLEDNYSLFFTKSNDQIKVLKARHEPVNFHAVLNLFQLVIFC